MPSASTRIEIVQRAVKQAGRSAEIYAHAKELLNDLLRGCAYNNRYKILKKVGAQLVLPAGSDTLALPVDFGAATDSLIFDDTALPLIEFELDDFVERGGFQRVGVSSNRPSFFMTDTNARLWRFGSVADKNYTFTPVYFVVPENIPVEQSSDQEKVWYENDEAIINGLIWKIFGYTDDVREQAQKAVWEQKDAEYRRGTSPIQAGSTKLRLSRASFPLRRSTRRWLGA